jgi:hypothetical protein
VAKKITVDLSEEQHKRFVNAKMDQGLRSLQQLMIEATEQAIAGTKASKHGNTGQNTTTTRTSGNTPSTATPKVLSASDLSEMIPSCLLDWMHLVERAVTVKDATWVSMLSSIKHQLWR